MLKERSISGGKNLFQRDTSGSNGCSSNGACEVSTQHYFVKNTPPVLKVDQIVVCQGFQEPHAKYNGTTGRIVKDGPEPILEFDDGSQIQGNNTHFKITFYKQTYKI
jgi:hypothetical protein